MKYFVFEKTNILLKRILFSNNSLGVKINGQELYNR